MLGWYDHMQYNTEKLTGSFLNILGRRSLTQGDVNHKYNNKCKIYVKWQTTIKYPYSLQGKK